MYAIIATWKMSYPSVCDAQHLLQEGAAAGDAVVEAITQIEDDPSLNSVGYGGLPDRDGHVMLDAAYMDGQTLRCGAIMSAEGIRNPILAARKLCGRESNCVLAGRGAELFAIEEGLPMRDMRTHASMQHWREAIRMEHRKLSAYRDHDTVCVLALDEDGGLVAGTSTSGLFMKAPGRVGDSPLIGSGYYADARYGAAAATGVGEEIMRGCLSYEIVSLMKRGASAQQACEEAMNDFVSRKLELGEDAGSMSVIALAPDGTFGAATTLDVFPFTVGNESGVHLCAVKNGVVTEVTEEEVAKLP